MIRYLNLKAYGKVNLGLDVTGRREDGYHEVRMIMQTVGIYDRIDLLYRDRPGVTIETNLRYIPENGNNLACRAANLLMEEFGIRQGVHIRLRKYVPVAAGMGGGSSDAAAVLFGVNKMFGLGLTAEELRQRALQIGADVPFCVLRGTALCEGIGEILTPLPPAPRCHVLIAKPAAGVSTKTVYENFDADAADPSRRPDIDGIAEAIRRRDLAGMAAKMGNVLETVTEPLCPEIRDIRQMLMEAGALNARMSGSGPTVFGLFDDSGKAEAACDRMRRGAGSRLARQVYLTGFYNPGAEALTAKREDGIRDGV